MIFYISGRSGLDGVLHFVGFHPEICVLCPGSYRCQISAQFLPMDFVFRAGGLSRPLWVAGKGIFSQFICYSQLLVEFYLKLKHVIYLFILISVAIETLFLVVRDTETHFS